MKKTFLVLIPVLLFTSVLFGSTGTAIISPSVVGAGSTGMTFTISYSPSTYWGTSGFLYVQIPPVGGWTSPTVGNSAPGNVTVVVASTTGGGTTFIPTSNVTISGNMITISAS